MREKCPYSELFWSVYSYIRTEYREILRISPPPYSVQMRENTDQSNSEYGQFLRSAAVHHLMQTLKIIWVNWVINPGVFEHKMKMMGDLNLLH